MSRSTRWVTQLGLARNWLSVALLLCISATAAGVPHANQAEATTHRAVRSFSESWVLPGGPLQVTISVSGYGGIGQVVETLPPGFTYESSSLQSVAVRVDGQTVLFTLLGEDRLTYTVTAADEEDRYEFAGIFKDSNKVEEAVSGQAEILVSETPPPAPTPSPTPTESPTPSATVTTTPSPMPTPSLSPTPTPSLTPSPTPSLSLAPTVTAGLTNTPTPRSTPQPETTPTETPSQEVVSAETQADEQVASTAMSQENPAPVPTIQVPESEGGIDGWVAYLIVACATFVSGAGLTYVLMRRR